MNRLHPFELAVPVTAIDHIAGAPRAPLTIVEYGDFECPTCKQAAPMVKLLLNEFRERIRFVYRHYPLEEVHPHALYAAEAAEAAGAQGNFWELHDLLFANQLHLEPAQIRGYAKSLDIDFPRFISDIDDEIYRQRVREHMAGGRESGVRATPTFFVNGRIEDVSSGVHTLYDSVTALLRKQNG